MKFYLKQYPDGGWEFSPVGHGIDKVKLAAGFKIVNKIPQMIKDKMPGGKNWVEPENPQDIKIRELETRLNALEAKHGIEMGHLPAHADEVDRSGDNK